ncbi:LLM class flavin-dependent oxidoreductase [Micromonospora sp. BRA006-A]|nr:LLM class flavin-dependent oxidoreductase [Micromonospora sp. BRA006-A]
MSETAGGDMEIYDLKVTVDRIEGRSVCGMAVGDHFELTNSAHLRLPRESISAWTRSPRCCPSSPPSSVTWRRGLAGPGLPLHLPRPGGAARHEGGADLPAHDELGGPDMTVEIGLGLQSDKPAGAYARLARAAEAHGLDVLTVFGDLMYQPPIFPLLEIAQATERVRLGAACLNPYSMAPYEIAGQLAALDLASHGRAYLGLARGPGWALGSACRSRGR